MLGSSRRRAIDEKCGIRREHDGPDLGELDVTPAWRLRNRRNGLLFAKHAYGIGEDHERIRGQPLSIEVRVSLPELLLQRDQILPQCSYRSS